MNCKATETQGMLLIISGPSGVGKTTITHRVVEATGGVFSVSMTTRDKTAEDVEGRDYFFVSLEKFRREVDAGNMLEWAEVFGNCYGTPRQFVQEQMDQGRLVILEIDVEGAIQIRNNMPDAAAIFVLPPDEPTLLERLRKRSREDEATIQRRFAKAKLEIERARDSGVYDLYIVNDDLEQAVREAVDAVNRMRRERTTQSGGR